MDDVSLCVVGGAYIEECAFPRCRVYRGSGGRAASFLSGLSVPVVFSTTLGPISAVAFKGLASEFNYTLDSTEGQDDIRFFYQFPMGRPEILPHIRKPVQSSKSIDCDKALVFGMLEGRPTVRAKRVIYDPQDGYLSKPFRHNGSDAEELVLIVSGSEGEALSGSSDPERITQAILDSDNTVVAVVVKNGPLGAFVKTRDSEAWVKPFPSRSVYKIGSGDIFSAAFTYYWFYRNDNAIDAAWFASRVSSAYVETAQDRFRTEDVEQFIKEAGEAKHEFRELSKPSIPPKKIYLAGPFFTTSQQWLVDEVRNALLRLGFEVLSPFHDIGLGEASEVASKDIEELRKSGVVLALLDGMDSGTLFEVGYARSIGLPVVAVAEAVKESDLTMISGTGCLVTSDLSTGIYKACWELMENA